jgi:ABC-type dipeptide/oligopeptide/nickel transport system ATPase subunit
MATTARKFEVKPAIRESVPLLVGLMGPSGSGKTFSALRLATGIQQISGGDIYGIDTEARRMLHYADQFRFKHLEFNAPFGSLDYLAAIDHCIRDGAKVIIIDSMTHEHTGPGGYLQTQDAEVDRMAGNDLAKRERVKMAGWIKPSALRQRMISGLLQMNANFIFCFRAKEKTKPKTGGGIVEMGFMPVAGEELLFEMTVNCLLPPKSNGVPQWRSDQIGERMMMKLPTQFTDTFADSKSLDENTGVALAQWAKGGTAAPSELRPQPQDGAADILMEIEADLDQSAKFGTAALEEAWTSLHKKHRQAFAGKLAGLKDIAANADKSAALAAAQEIGT